MAIPVLVSRAQPLAQGLTHELAIREVADGMNHHRTDIGHPLFES
jgi:hypothetical protein